VKVSSWIPAAVVVSLFGLVGFKTLQGEPLQRAQLREMMVQLGYDVKDLNTEAGKEKYSVSLSSDNLNVPVGVEISPSMSYVWLTVNLGAEATADKALALLKKNAELQPTFFYQTKSGRLMCALPIDNRGITNALLRQRIERIASDVGKSQDAWK
jgi:hypothetical protein